MRSPKFWEARDAIQNTPGAPYPGKVCRPDCPRQAQAIKGQIALENRYYSGAHILSKATTQDDLLKEAKAINEWYLQNSDMDNTRCDVMFAEAGYGYFDGRKAIQINSTKVGDGTIVHEVKPPQEVEEPTV